MRGNLPSVGGLVNPAERIRPVALYGHEAGVGAEGICLGAVSKLGSDFQFGNSKCGPKREQVVNRVLMVWTSRVPRCSAKVAGVLPPVLHIRACPWNVHWCGVEHVSGELFTAL
jgi:hypothetical protein